jgi:probable phosphoglycerate mutase
MAPDLELWLVRHGETTSNVESRLAGWHDVPLTTKGESQAASLRAHLDGERFDGVWSSDLVRAVETARLAYGEPRQEHRLREIHFGRLEGEPWNDIDPAYGEALVNFEGFSAPGGEDLSGFRSRVEEFLRTLEAGRHLIFTHGGVIRLLTYDLGLDRFMPNGTLLAVDWTDRRVLFVHEPDA